jgi:hypothetical protein
VLFRIKGTTNEVKSTLKANTNRPVWDEEEGLLHLHDVAGVDELEIEVYDKDSANADDLIGRTCINLSGLQSSDQQTPIALTLNDAGSRRDKVGDWGVVYLSWVRTLHFPALNEESSSSDIQAAFDAYIPKEHGEVVSIELESALKRTADEMGLHEAKDENGVTHDRDSEEPSYLLENTVKKEPLVRKEIRTMSEMEQKRFVLAIRTMMERHSIGGETQEISEWFRLASYHGWPSNEGSGYCAQGTENFPNWHRIYCLEMERAMQIADTLNGGDGRIALPYWNFAVPEYKGKVIPDVVRFAFGIEFSFPEGFFDSEDGRSSGGESLKEAFFSGLNEDSEVSSRLRNSGVSEDTFACLNDAENHQFWMFASTENNRGVSIEQIFNTVRMALGHPLTSLHHAAYHPLFWLLLCNVDRICEAYIRNTPVGAAECIAEMKWHQAWNGRRGRKNLAEEPLTPFKKSDGTDYLLEDAFETSPLGYVYDQLPLRPAPKLRELPTLVLFRGVDFVRNLVDSEGNMKSFNLHLFVYPPGSKGELPLARSIDDVFVHENYAGSNAIFAGKGTECEPICVKRDITAKLKQLNIKTSEDIVLKVLAEDDEGMFVPFESLQETYGPQLIIPQPRIVGPMFCESPPVLHKGVEALNPESIPTLRKMQAYLKRFGYYEGSIDGVFGADTEDALKLFQETAGLDADGVGGRMTLTHIMAPLHDAMKHKLGNAAGPAYARLARYKSFEGSKVKCFIGLIPTYLSTEGVRTVIGEALSAWSRPTGLVFDITCNEAEADGGMKFLFGLPAAIDTEDISDADMSMQDKLPFNGLGGELARTEDTTVIFDLTERWVLGNGSERGSATVKTNRKTFDLKTVVLHAIGHVLGLAHSSHPLDVMNPYYCVGRVELTSRDEARAAALYA